MSPSVVSEKKGGWSTWSAGKKFLVVLACIAGGCFLIVMLAGAYGYWWMMARGDQLPSTIVLSDDTTGYFSLHAEAEDPGVTKLLELIARKMNEQDAKSYPKGMPEPLRAFLGNRQDATALRTIWVREATVSFSKGEDDEPELSAAVNLNALGGLVRMMMKLFGWVAREEQKKAGGEEVEARLDYYRRREIWVTPPVEITLLGTTIAVLTTREDTQRVIDRAMEAEAQPDAAAALPEKFQAPAQRFRAKNDAHLILDDPTVLANAIENMPPESATAALEPVKRFGGGFDLVSDDEIHGQLVFECKSAEGAQRARPAVDAILATLAQEAANSGLMLTSVPRLEGSEIIVDQKLSGIRRVIEEAVEEIYIEQSE